MITAQPSAQYCLKIDARDSEGKWTTIKQCTRLVGGGSLEIVERGIVGINVSVCLVGRPEVCGPPTKAQICESHFIFCFVFLFSCGWLAGLVDWLMDWLTVKCFVHLVLLGLAG